MPTAPVKQLNESMRKFRSWAKNVFLV